MFIYRSIQIGWTGVWTAQRYRDTGTSVVHQVLSTHTDLAGAQGGNASVGAKQLADAACAGYAAALGGTFDSGNNDPFE